MEGSTRSLFICRLLIGENAKNLTRDKIPNQWTKPAFNAGIMDKGCRNTGIAVSRNTDGESKHRTHTAANGGNNAAK